MHTQTACPKILINRQALCLQKSPQNIFKTSKNPSRQIHKMEDKMIFEFGKGDLPSALIVMSTVALAGAIVLFLDYLSRKKEQRSNRHSIEIIPGKK